jgi:Arc/MetJ-type ribon-helix-helix transcriptional regulator
MIESKELIKNKSVATKLTVADQKEINKLVDAGLFLNNVDFIRQAIRDKINEYKIINIREVPKEQAKKEIKKYMEIHDIAYVSEIAEKLDLDLVYELEEVEATGN